MKVSDFLLSIYQQGITVQVEQGNLKIGAPRGALSPEIKDQLHERKAEIIAFLLDEQVASYRSIPLRRVDRSRPIPASSSQRGLWFQYKLEGLSNTYNEPFVYRLKGEINIPALEKSLQYLIARHESLRMSFMAVDGKPYLVIADKVEWKLDIHHSNGTAVERDLKEMAARPFSLEQAPLFRAYLWTDLVDNHTLLLNFHHIISDGWTQGIFERELSSVYASIISGKESALPALELDFADYAAWQQDWLKSAEIEQGLMFWKEVLRGAPELLELPIDHPRPVVQTYRGDKVKLDLEPDLVGKLQQLAHQEHGTLFMLMNAAFAILLGRYSRQEDVVIGVPMANRPLKELESIVGFFVNTLPMRIDLSNNPTLPELLKQMRQIALNVYAHQSVPFEKLVEEVLSRRDPGFNPIFQVIFNFVNAQSQGFHIGKCKASPAMVDMASSKFDLNLTVMEHGQALHLELQYNTDLFGPVTAERMLIHYKHILEWTVSGLNHGIYEFDLLTEAERQQILIEWNNTATEYPKHNGLHELITAQAEKNPDAPAIICNGRQLTYTALEQRSNQLSAYLLANGVGSGTLIGIYMPRSEELLVSQLAILKSGGAYVPLDLTYPAERLAYMLQDANPALVITQSALAAQLPDHCHKICLDVETDAIRACSDEEGVIPSDEDAILYVTYTSGSTGRPNGVMTFQRGVLNYLLHLVKNFALKAGERVIQITPLSFDAACRDTLGVLTFGGTVILMDDEQMSDPDFISATILEQQVTCILSVVPTMLRAIARSASKHGAQENRLGLIMPSGEALQVVDVDLVRNAFGNNVQIINQYGPTECSMIATMYPIPAEFPGNHQAVPIGKPISNVQVYVLDQNHRPVPIGVTGELYIGGSAVGYGYLNQPELTTERFIANLFQPGERMYRTGDLARYSQDGTIFYLGRLDHQVKIRGYRVELGEIETIARECPGIQDAAVVLWTNQPVEVLAVYITLSELERGQAKEALHHYLADHLPFYMLPSAIIVLDEMPLTPNRKIDHKALPAPGMNTLENQGYIAPCTQTEQILAKIWMDVLGVTRVSVEDNFFDIGGNSLSAIRVLSRIRDEIKIAVSVKRIFEFPWLSELAKYVDSVLIDPKQSPVLREELNDHKELVL